MASDDPDASADMSRVDAKKQNRTESCSRSSAPSQMAAATASIDAARQCSDNIIEKEVDENKLKCTVKVFNLTPTVTAAHMREIASCYGTVISVNCLKNKNVANVLSGSFAVEFSSEKETKAAKEHLHQGFIDGQVVTVELACPQPKSPPKSVQQPSKRPTASPRRSSYIRSSPVRRGINRRVLPPRIMSPRSRRRSPPPVRRRRSSSRSRSIPARRDFEKSRLKAGGPPATSRKRSVSRSGSVSADSRGSSSWSSRSVSRSLSVSSRRRHRRSSSWTSGTSSSPRRDAPRRRSGRR